MLGFQRGQVRGLADDGLPELPELFGGGTGFNLLGFMPLDLPGQFGDRPREIIDLRGFR